MSNQKKRSSAPKKAAKRSTKRQKSHNKAKKKDEEKAESVHMNPGGGMTATTVDDNGGGTDLVKSCKAIIDFLPDYDKISKDLLHHCWYHGMMPREEVEELLKNNGEFLLRRTDVANKDRYAVSVYYNKLTRHILLDHTDGFWTIDKIQKKSVVELIEYLVEKQHPIRSNIILSVPISRSGYYILHEHLGVGNKLGGGEFGNVYIGAWKKAQGKIVNVAIKKFVGIMHKKERCEFVKEARIMRKFKHKNLVRLFGVAPNEMPLMIVMELCSGGSLLSHLKKNPDLKADKLTAYCIDACRGMCYLSLRKVIHRDIAARNCLLGDHDECKISDFGLSVATKGTYQDEISPIATKWAAPEALKKREFSTKSDVWSFGVMIWEVFVHCKSDPFPDDTNAQARAKICSGHDPFEAPEGTPPLLQSVMKLCFTQDPNQRPDFEALFKILSPNETPPQNED